MYKCLHVHVDTHHKLACTCIYIICDNLFLCGGVVKDIVDPPCFGEDDSKAQGIAQGEQPKTNLEGK